MSVYNSNSTSAFLSMFTMPILVLIKSELDQAHIFQYTCWKDFEIHLHIIMQHFERKNHDNHRDF